MKNKTTAAKVLLAAGWTWDEVKAVLDGSEPLPEPIAPDGPKPAPYWISHPIAPPPYPSYTLTVSNPTGMIYVKSTETLLND